MPLLDPASAASGPGEASRELDVEVEPDAGVDEAASALRAEGVVLAAAPGVTFAVVAVPVEVVDLMGVDSEAGGIGVVVAEVGGLGR